VVVGVVACAPQCQGADHPSKVVVVVVVAHVRALGSTWLRGMQRALLVKVKVVLQEWPQVS
jgi:hypothetical protein